MNKVSKIKIDTSARRINLASMLLVVLAFAGLGTYLLRNSLASTPTASLNVASGTLSGNASIVSDANAYNGKAVRFGQSVAKAQVCQSMAIPAYFDPLWSGSPWAAATASTPGVSIMIANVDNGPGTSVNADYPPAFAAAKAAGIRVLGYVDTKYGTDSIASVEANVNTWKNLYGVTDIFFDEVSAQAADEPYYQALTAYVHSETPGSITMINPGTVPDQSYINAADIISIFEGSYATYESTTFPAWISDYAPTHFFNVVYGVPNQTAMTQVLSSAAQKNVGYVFATDAGLPNPYDVVPSFLSSEASEAHANCTF